jgi:uncharacterized protein YggE
MKGLGFFLVSTFLFGPYAAAQNPPAPQSVQAAGSATVSAAPDQVKVSIGVTTTANTAQEAAAENATQMNAVITQIRQVLGAAADIRTIGYSVSPNYRGNPPVLSGYTAMNTVEVTAGESQAIIKVIDSVSTVGATNIQGLRFAVRDDEPLKRQALAAAAKQAMGHAQAIAGGLGMRIGTVVAAQEGFSSSPILGVATPPERAATPVEPGLVQVTATVTIVAQLMP